MTLWKKTQPPTESPARPVGQTAEEVARDFRKDLPPSRLESQLRNKDYEAIQAGWTDPLVAEKEIASLPSLRHKTDLDLDSDPAFQALIWTQFVRPETTNRAFLLITQLMSNVDQAGRTGDIMKVLKLRVNLDPSARYHIFRSTLPYPTALIKELETILDQPNPGLTRDLIVALASMKDEAAHTKILTHWMQKFDHLPEESKPFLFKALNRDAKTGPEFRKNKKVYYRRLEKGQGPLWDELRMTEPAL